MELNKNKYSAKEVRRMLDEIETDYRDRFSAQKEKIASLTTENREMRSQLNEYVNKKNHIEKALTDAETQASAIVKNAELSYELERLKIKRFSEKWDKYFTLLKEKYPLYPYVKKTCEISDKLNDVLSCNGKQVVSVAEKLVEKKDNEAFNPMSRINDYVAASGDNGFNLDDVLNPGELRLEDLCEELGLIEKE